MKKSRYSEAQIVAVLKEAEKGGFCRKVWRRIKKTRILFSA
jgi:hypothetical protein